jgi:hypothetical protein
MWWHKCGPIWPPPWKGGDISGCRCRTWPPMVSLEPAWKDASIDTLNSLIRGPWGRQKYFWLNQRYIRCRSRTRPPMVSWWPPWKDTSIDTPHTLIRGPWGPQHHIDTPSLLSRHFDQPNKAAAVRDCSDLKQRHILTAAAIHSQHLWKGSGKNYLLLH